MAQFIDDTVQFYHCTTVQLYNCQRLGDLTGVTAMLDPWSLLFGKAAKPSKSLTFNKCGWQHWDIIWKSRGGIMVNGVSWEVPMPESEGSQAPRIFGHGTSQGHTFTIIPPRFFHTKSFFRHPGLIKRDLFQPI